MKVVISGGHLTPALAVLEELSSKTEIVYIGRKYALEGDKALSLEYQTITALGVPFKVLRAARLQRRLTRYSFLALLRFPKGLGQAILLLWREKPAVVVSFGSYIGLTLSLAAWMLKIPVVVHEQTMGAGLANKITAKFAKNICISWETSREFFPKKKTILTGNPLRKTFFSDLKIRPASAKYPLIYITGGSLGSHAINRLVEASLPKLLEKYAVLQQTGGAKEYKDFDRLQALKKTLSPAQSNRYEVVQFVSPHEVVGHLASADLVISRAGMNTVCELLYLGTPCLLIPLPHGQNGEQERNARFVGKIGIGEVLEEEFLTPERFSEQVLRMMEHLADYREYKGIGQAYIHKDAAQKIMEVIERAGS